MFDEEHMLHFSAMTWLHASVLLTLLGNKKSSGRGRILLKPLRLNQKVLSVVFLVTYLW
jgi:hypothetical protein